MTVQLWESLPFRVGRMSTSLKYWPAIALLPTRNQ